MAAVLDLCKRIIPDTVVKLLLYIAVLSMIGLPLMACLEKVGGAIGAGLLLGGCALLFPGKLGGGDCKLAVVCGLFLGFDRIFQTLFVGLLAAFVTGIFVNLYRIRAAVSIGNVQQKKTGSLSLPLGPFLAGGILFVCRDLIW